MSWSTQTARYLTDWTTCPRCGASLGERTTCARCWADLATPTGLEVRQASERAAAAISERQSLIDRLTIVRPAPSPRVREYSATVVAAASTAPALAGAAPSGPPLTPANATAVSSSSSSSSSSGSQLSVQSVLAVAGATLFAIAAIVFTFLNPDLTNFGTRTAIVGAVTVVFLGTAWLLVRAKLQFSAEAVGALGMVFVGLDVWALSSLAWPGVSGWFLGGVGTLVAALAMLAVARLARLRTWLWVSLAALAITPSFFGYAVGGMWAATIGHVGVAIVALALHDLIRPLRKRFDAPLTADRTTATIIEFGYGVVVLGQLVVAPGVLEAAAIIGLLAIIAAFSTRNQMPASWSVISGGLVVVAIGILPLALTVDSNWQLALVPLAGAAGLTLLGGLTLVDARRTATSIRRMPVLAGGWTIALIAAVPAAVISSIQLLSTQEPEFPAMIGLAAILGLLSASAGSLGLSHALRRVGGIAEHPTEHRVSTGAFAVSLWLALLAVLATISWPGMSDVARVIVGLAVAVALSGLVVRTPAARSRVVRVPVVVGAHVALVLATVVAWNSPTLSIVGSAGAVAAVIAVAHTVPKKVRPLHAAAGFTLALFAIAHALSLAGLDTVVVLCLTTSVAALFAIAVTLIRRLSAGFWYAILAVTLVPFLIGIVSVLFVRSGWTALSTGVTFALAFTLVVTRRPGLSRHLRTFAAALLVPALAVVVVCLGAQVILVSASPITLPIIAFIVGCVLPSTELIAAALARRELPEVDIRAAVTWIEISALLTGALAVVLALARAAAGLNTSFLVLLIIGIGAAVTALTTKRRYAWVVAGAAWTGALWCIWALLDVTIIEPYLLPPAIAAAIIGAISVSRKLPGLGLYTIGLACAIVPTLATLAVAGNGGDVEWRAYGLLAGAAALVALGAIRTGTSHRASINRLGMLRPPTLFVALLASSAGTVEAIRLGLALEPVTPGRVMLPVLAFTVASTIVAVAAGALLLRVAAASDSARLQRVHSSRWLFAPALAYLVLGPIAAAHNGWFSTWVLWSLAAALLITMLLSVAAQRRGTSALPPAWFIFALAWFTAVAGWSERLLRVEAFSLVLGFALLAAGILAMRRPSDMNEPAAKSWPHGYVGSWRLLAPGIVVVFLPSVLATGTDPQTLRAVLVIALALVAILLGSLLKLAAPFILGIIVLPLENITVFAVQVGRSIGAAPWWITLATAGAVLLVVSVTHERRDAGNRGVAARLRDLR